MFALVPNLFPDTAQFPRIDTRPGTLGAIFEKLLGPGFALDGTLPNANLLDNISSNEYLKKQVCTDSTQVWTGIALDGTPMCGSKLHILASFGTLSDIVGIVEVYRSPS